MKQPIRNLIILIFISFEIFSQDYNIKHYTVADGLLHSFVSDIIQDKAGNIWIATGGGLCKFNGVEFVSYTTKDGLYYTRLISLAEDKNNNIWIGTTEGLNVFDGKAIYKYYNKDKEKIKAIEKSNDGKMWVSSNLGLKKIGFKNGAFTTEKIIANFGEANDIQIFQDEKQNFFLIETANNKLFIGLNNSLFVYENKKARKIEIPEKIEIYSACNLKNNKIIFGTNNGLYYFDNEKFIHLENAKLNGFKVYKIKRKKQKIWMIGKWGNENEDELFLVSINLNDKKYYRKISVSNGLIDNPTSLFIDHENNIWTGSNGGLSVLKGESFVNYTTKNGIVGNKIWGIYQDSENAIYVGTINEGFSIINNDSILNFNEKTGLPDLYVSSFFKKEKNNFYFGTVNKGLCKATYKEKNKKYSFQQIKSNKLLENTRIDQIKIDYNNIIWVASYNGLFYSTDGINFQRKTLFKNDSDVEVQYLLLAKNKKIYVGTKKNGLFELYKNEVKQINLGRNNIGVSSLCEDLQGNIWGASQNNGIVKINNNKTVWITEKNGLKSNLIYILQADKNGNIWAGSNLGLDKFNATTYNKTGILEIRHYGTDDGLKDIEMNLNGSIEDNLGNLWFASNNGILKYDYRYDLSNRVPPIISLLDVKIHSKKVDWKKYSKSLSHWNNLPINPILPYFQNHITFEFIGISYKNPKEIKYSWKLEGFDKKWVPNSSNRQVIYSNLPVGKYIFKVKSSNNDGVWNQTALEFPFEITPPFWLTWWFITASIIFLLLTVYLVVKFRIRQFKIREKELEKIVRDRTQEIYLQKEELKAQMDIVFQQKQKIETIHLDLSDSIDYASLIQNSILSDEKILQKNIANHFLFFKPKDKVSGDFYWWCNLKNETVISAADCTGHGVPGAFMSMLGISFLKEIVEKEKIKTPAKILNSLRNYIIEALKQDSVLNDQKDGMDMSIIVINHETNTLQFSGANNPIYVIKNEQITQIHERIKLSETNITNESSKFLYEIKADKMPIAIYSKMGNFTNIEINVQKGDQIYLFSDGFADQFGGENKKKFRYQPFKKILINNSHKPMNEINKELQKAFYEWKGNLDQIDDIVIIGIQI